MQRVRTWLLAGLGLITASALVAGVPSRLPRHAMHAQPQVESVIVKKEVKNALVESARKYLGIPYKEEGRLLVKNHKPAGLDCLGLIYAALEDVYGIGWRHQHGAFHWSTTPSILMRQLDKTRKNTEIIVPGFDVLAGLHGAKSGIPVALRSFSFPPANVIIDSTKALKLTAAMAATNDTSQRQTDSTALAYLKPGDFLFLLWPVKPPKENYDIPVAKDQFGHDLYVWHTAMYTGDGWMIHASPGFKNAWGDAISSVYEENLMSFLRTNACSGFVRVRYYGVRHG